MLVQCVCQVERPFGDTVADIRTVTVNEACVARVLKRIDVRNRVINDGIVLNPNRVMRPERLCGITAADRVLYLWNMRLVRTHNDVQRIDLTAVINYGVVRNLYTNPFVFPFVHFLTIRVKGRMNGISDINRHILLAYEDRVTTIDVEVRNDSQVDIHNRVATACGLEVLCRQISFLVERTLIVALTYHVRQTVLADGVKALDIIIFVDLDAYMEDRVARSVRIVRIHRDIFCKLRILHIRFVTPGSTERTTTLYINGCVIRMRNSQIQTVELTDLTVRTEDRIGEHTAGVVVLMVMEPGVRQFGITNNDRRTIFGYHVNLIDIFATRCRINLIFDRIGLGDRLTDGLIVPYKALIDVQDTLLNDMILRDLGDLQVDDTVALVTRVLLVYRIAEHETDGVFDRVEITLFVDDRVFVLAYLDTLYALRSRIDGQVDAVDTVGVIIDRLEYILILFGLTHRVLQILTAP